MTPRRYKIHDEFYPYFITCGLLFGLPVFSDPKAVHIIMKNLVFLQSNRQVKITAYVIMENHLHAIVRGDDLAAKIGRFKSYSAREIIDLFKQNGRTRWLKRLRQVKSKIKTDRTYQLWQEGYHPKQIVGDDMMVQKIAYIHQNPVKRGYVDDPEDWRYSSARNYAGRKGLMLVTEFIR